MFRKKVVIVINDKKSIKNKKMKCTCGKKAKRKKGLKFNGYNIDGWVCDKCGIIAYDPIQAEKILLMNKIKKKKYFLKLSKIRSNLIIRIPKEVSDLLGLKKGNKVEFGLDNENIVIKQT